MRKVMSLVRTLTYKNLICYSQRTEIDNAINKYYTTNNSLRPLNTLFHIHSHHRNNNFSWMNSKLSIQKACDIRRG